MKSPKSSYPKRLSNVEKLDVITLFHTNLNAMREHYRGEQFSGHHLGHNVLMEMAISHMLMALGDAKEGKLWQPPG